ncbi:MAG: hypothetical protein ABI323_12925 [Solirubrobacteraceae bacterium]
MGWRLARAHLIVCSCTDLVVPILIEEEVSEMRNLGARNPPASYQTVKLARGRHSSLEDGVCVMELASMLADEPFSDRPQSVCPVIGAFLRAYNDRVDDRWRQDLYAYAAKVVGTRSTISVEGQRAQMCREWARQTRAGGALPAQPVGPPHQHGRLRGWLQSYRHRPEHAGRRAAITFGRRELDYQGHMLDDELHRAALRFVDELIAVGRNDDPGLAELHAISVEHPPARTW